MPASIRERKARDELFAGLQEELESRGVRAIRSRDVLNWSPAPGVLSWAHVFAYSGVVERFHFSHFHGCFSARVAHELGLLERPRWRRGQPFRCPFGVLPAFQFTFLLEEVDDAVCKWLASRALDDIHPDAPPFMSRRHASGDCMWTAKALAAQEVWQAEENLRREKVREERSRRSSSNT